MKQSWSATRSCRRFGSFPERRELGTGPVSRKETTTDSRVNGNVSANCGTFLDRELHDVSLCSPGILLRDDGLPHPPEIWSPSVSHHSSCKPST